MGQSSARLCCFDTLTASFVWVPLNKRSGILTGGLCDFIASAAGTVSSFSSILST